MREEISWRDVLASHAQYGNVKYIAHMASVTGYRYFEWNDRIYEIDTIDGIVDTGILSADLNICTIKKRIK
jgi:hypothetical protein